MKIKFLATAQAPDEYEFNGETVTAINNGESEDFDFSGLQEGGEIDNIVVEMLDLHSSQIVREVERINGELHLTLCQQSGSSGHWRSSDEIDASEYDLAETYIKRIDADGNS